MTHRLNKYEMLILRRVFMSDKALDIGALANGITLPLFEVMKGVSSLRQRGLISIENSQLRATAAGRRWSFENQRFFAHRGEKHWRKIPDQFLGPTLAPNEPYAPKRSMMKSKRIFSRHTA